VVVLHFELVIHFASTFIDRFRGVTLAQNEKKVGHCGDKVRREKALDFSGCNSRPGTGSLHPVAIEAAAEATKLSELSM
jgi:hypothetical protein